MFSWQMPLSTHSLNLPQDPLDSNVKEEITAGEEEEVNEEYDSGFNLSLSLSDLSGDEEEESNTVVPLTLTTPNGCEVIMM